MNSKMDDRELLKRLNALPRELEPVNDPWDRISARLDEASVPAAARNTPGTPRFAWAGWMPAAAAAAAVVVVLMAWLPGNDHAPGALPTPVSEPAVSASRGPAPMPAGVAGAQAEYFAAFREFKPLGTSRDRLAAPTLAQIETGWSELQHVESALKDALASDPDDPFLNRRMLELRSRQLGFLRQLAALEHSNWRLTI